MNEFLRTFSGAWQDKECYLCGSHPVGRQNPSDGTRETFKKQRKDFSKSHHHRYTELVALLFGIHNPLVILPINEFLRTISGTWQDKKGYLCGSRSLGRQNWSQSTQWVFRNRRPMSRNSQPPRFVELMQFSSGNLNASVFHARSTFTAQFQWYGETEKSMCTQVTLLVVYTWAKVHWVILQAEPRQIHIHIGCTLWMLAAAVKATAIFLFESQIGKKKQFRSRLVAILRTDLFAERRGATYLKWWKVTRSTARIPMPNVPDFSWPDDI